MKGMDVWMKILLVGGAYQSKLAYAMKEYKISRDQIADGASPFFPGDWNKPCINNLHLLVRRLLEQGQTPLDEVLPRLEQRQDWLVICDEIGCGIVPADAFSRRWREAVGRLCCALAQSADVVERVTLGLPQRIKG